MNPNFMSSSSSSYEDGENSHMIYTYNQFMQDMQRRSDNNNMLIQYLHDHQSPQIYRGSVPGHIVINRDREGAHARLYNGFFGNNPLYNKPCFVGDSGCLVHCSFVLWMQLRNTMTTSCNDQMEPEGLD